jgi:prophage regulatory protein
MEQSNVSEGERLLRLPEVTARTGLRKSALYAAIKQNKFPAGLKISSRSSAWKLSEVNAWIADRIRAAQRGTK